MYPLPSLLTEQIINDRLATFASDIYKDYHHRTNLARPLVLLVILKGSTVFYVDLMRQLARLDLPITSEFISISSYGHGTSSSGEIQFELDTRSSIEGRHVLVIEDIIDTGRTLSGVMQKLKNRKPGSLEITTLLSKPSRREVEVKVKYTGFVIEDHFVVGYGLDYAERFRELPYIGILTDESKAKIDQQSN
jgi:hypoxanthine phosphoribosyltransferase